MTTRWFRGTVTGVTGAGITFLDSVLRTTPVGTVTLDSLVVSGGIATGTRAAGISFLQYQMVTIAGAGPSGLNGEWRITAATGTTFTFSTAVADQTATGTITAELAPLGWSKPYSGTNKAVYLPAGVDATGNMLRIDDANAQYMRARGYRAMSDVDTGTDPFPTDSQVSGGIYVSKSSTSSATTREYILVGDGRFFYLSVLYNGTAGRMFRFGDYISWHQTDDQWDCEISGPLTAHGNDNFDYMNGTTGLNDGYSPRSHTGTGTAVNTSLRGPWAYSSRNDNCPYPSGVFGSGVLALDPVMVEQNTAPIDWRGIFPGLICLANNCYNNLTFGQILTVPNYTDPLICLQTSGAYGKFVAVDLGNWR